MVFISNVSSVDASSTKNLGTVNVDSKDAIKVNNDNAPKFVKAPKIYSNSKKHTKIKTKKGKKYKFYTKYFLPVTWKKGGKNGGMEYWYNCQSIAISGKYMYILTSSGYNKDKGFIIRYDTSVLNKYSNGKNKHILKNIGTKMKNGKHLTKKQKRIKKAIKIGSVFNIGHGQSLSYNPKKKSLWMWQDKSKSKSHNLKLMKINMKTFKPSKIYKFKAKLNGKYLTTINNLNFDKDGAFYFDKNLKTKHNSLSTRIFCGKIHNNQIEIKLLAVITKRPGTYPQSIAVNKKNNRLYLVSDGAIYSMPISKLCDGTLTKNDFFYSVFSTKREFEGISFDNKGHAYLLILRGTEVLKSNQIY